MLTWTINTVDKIINFLKSNQLIILLLIHHSNLGKMHAVASILRMSCTTDAAQSHSHHLLSDFNIFVSGVNSGLPAF